MATNNNKTSETTFEDKALKAAERQKKVTRAVCFFLAALMALGGTVGVIALFIN